MNGLSTISILNGEPIQVNKIFDINHYVTIFVPGDTLELNLDLYNELMKRD